MHTGIIQTRKTHIVKTPIHIVVLKGNYMNGNALSSPSIQYTQRITLAGTAWKHIALKIVADVQTWQCHMHGV